MSHRRRSSALAVSLFLILPLRAAAATVTGTIATEDGRALAGALVELRAQPSNYEKTLLMLAGVVESPPVATTAADAEGRFALEADAGAVWSLTVRAPGFVPLRWAPLGLTGPLELPPAVLPADAGSRVEVRDADGRPLRDAWVFARLPASRTPRDAWRPAPRLRRTGEDGAATLPRIAAERLDVSLFVPALTLLREKTGVDDAAFVVGPDPAAETRSTLQVRDARGRPRAGVLVALGNVGWPAGKTGDDGFLTLPGRPSVPLVVHLLGAAGEYLMTRLDSFPAVLTLLAPGRAGYGHVVDREERPLAGIEIRITPTGAPGSSRADLVDARSDGDGRFGVPHLPAARVDVLARGRGFAPTLVRGVVVPPGQGGVDLGTLILEPGAAIRGQVHDAGGEGVPGVSVWLSAVTGNPAADLLAEEPSTPPDAVTGADGSFAVADLRPGDRFDLVARADGYLPAAFEAVGAPTAEPLAVVLRPGYRLRGRVLDAVGDGVADAEVYLRPSLRDLTEVPLIGPEHQKHTRTEEDGAFRIDGVAAGRFEVTVTAAGFVPPEPRQVLVSPGLDDDVTVVLERGVILRGRVTTTDGEPVAGARILLDDASGVSDPDGAYRVTGLAPGRRSAEARHPVFRRVVEEVEIAADDDNSLDFVFEHGPAVRGRVVDETGEPVPAAFVELYHQDPEDRHAFTRRTGEDGRFEVPEVARGPYTVSATKEGFAPVETEDALVVDEAAVEDLEIVLPAGITLRGEIHGLDFDEVATVDVIAEGDGREPRRGRVGYGGDYEIADLAAGDWLVLATTRDGRREARARLTLEAGLREARHDLELGGGVTLDGQVLLDGEPLAGARVTLRGQDVAERRELLSDHQGRFRAEQVPPGAYRVGVAQYREMVVDNRDVVLDGDRELVIEVAGSRLHGYVAGEGGEPLAAARIRAQQWFSPEKPGSIYGIGTDEAGSFSLPRVPAGTYRVTVSRDGYATVAETIAVEPGDGGPRRFTLARSPGLALDVRLASGGRPRLVTASFFDAAGGSLVTGSLVTESRPLDGDGLARFPSVPEGTWRVLVDAPDAAVAETSVTVPGDPVPLVLSDAGRLRVRVGALVESDQIATVRLLGPDGRPLRSVDGSVDFPLAGGTAAVPGVPPGLWSVQVVAVDGRSWEGRVLTAAEKEAAVELD